MSLVSIVVSLVVHAKKQKSQRSSLPQSLVYLEAISVQQLLLATCSSTHALLCWSCRTFFRSNVVPRIWKRIEKWEGTTLVVLGRVMINTSSCISNRQQLASGREKAGRNCASESPAEKVPGVARARIQIFKIFTMPKIESTGLVVEGRLQSCQDYWELQEHKIGIAKDTARWSCSRYTFLVSTHHNDNVASSMLCWADCVSAAQSWTWSWND